jgi:molecular chaperone DnaK (HSP70)
MTGRCRRKSDGPLAPTRLYQESEQHMDIGIDLGTTNSVLAYLRGGPEVISIKGKPLLPSALAFDEGEWLVGSAAKSLAATKEYVIVSPKRAMGTDTTYAIAGKTYTPVDMSAMILAEIKKHAEDFLKEPVTSAIITIPAHFNQKQVDDTRKAAEQAGLKVGKLLAEPVAASATYGSGGEEIILVYDLGGGTFDCTVVDTFNAKILGLSGDNRLGGDDFDYRIVDRMAKHLQESSGLDIAGDKMARLMLKARAEQCKINLSEANATQVEYMGRLGGKLCEVNFRLGRQEYNKMIEDLVDRTLEMADEAVARSGLTREDIDVILLVGGSSLTPYVQERLAEHFGKPPSKRVDPMLAVGLGAAICTRDLPWDDKTHRVILRSRAEVWPKPTYPVRGRTSPGSKVKIRGGAQPVDTMASAEGQFTVEVPLVENAVNDLTVQATTPAEESATTIQRIRHDPQAGKAKEPVIESLPRPTLPRNILVGMKEDRVALLIPHGATLPHIGTADQFLCEANSTSFTLRGPIYEGHVPEHEIPYAPFNARMGELLMQCPPTPADTPLIVEFEVDESRTITVRCWFRDNPAIKGQVTLASKTQSREDKHLIERTEESVSAAGERARPEEKARINRKKQALIDLCEQYAASPSEETRQQIIGVGNELKSEVKALEQKYKL